MDPQEIFDKVATHLLTQGERSVDEYGRCLYRHPDGRKCAVGVLIKDEFYDPQLEELLFYTDRGLAALEASGVPVESAGVQELLIDLQQLHDSVDERLWLSSLFEIAEKFKLSDEVLKLWITNRS